MVLHQISSAIARCVWHTNERAVYVNVVVMWGTKVVRIA